MGEFLERYWVSFIRQGDSGTGFIKKEMLVNVVVPVVMRRGPKEQGVFDGIKVDGP
jgi:hypothetical protein